MARFRSGRVEASVADFDRAIQLQPSLAPYMWQRGLSLYYGKALYMDTYLVWTTNGDMKIAAADPKYNHAKTRTLCYQSRL